MKSAGGDEFSQNIHVMLRRRTGVRDRVAAKGRTSAVTVGLQLYSWSLRRRHMKATVRKSVLKRLPRRRVLIVNGAALWHDALVHLINHACDLQVCGEAFDETTALEQVGRLQPDLVLSEVLRPKDLGFIRELHRRYPQLPILAFSFRDEKSYAPRALEAGACGYLMKSVVGETLLTGIRKALEGRRVLSPGMAARLRRKNVSLRLTSPRKPCPEELQGRWSFTAAS